jgi:hypothetical protein
MQKLWKEFIKSSYQIKLFLFTTSIFWIAMIVTTAYCYGRLDFVRSYKTTTTEKTVTKEEVDHAG